MPLSHTWYTSNCVQLLVCERWVRVCYAIIRETEEKQEINSFSRERSTYSGEVIKKLFGKTNINPNPVSVLMIISAIVIFYQIILKLTPNLKSLRNGLCIACILLLKLDFLFRVTCMNVWGTWGVMRSFLLLKKAKLGDFKTAILSIYKNARLANTTKICTKMQRRNAHSRGDYTHTHKYSACWAAAMHGNNFSTSTSCHAFTIFPFCYLRRGERRRTKKTVRA